MDSKPRHPLRALLVAQFFGAFNDNAWKMLVPVLAIGAAGAELGEAGRQEWFSKAMLLFLVPMLIVSIPAGAIADRVSKRSVIVALKGLELALMGIGAISLWLAPTSFGVPLAVVAAMGLQSGLFSPAKYGILPEVLTHERLTRGNGLLEMWSFLAIIAGTALGPRLAGSEVFEPWHGAALLVTLAGVGFVASFGIPRVPASRDSGGVFDSLGSAYRAIRGDRPLWLAVLGATAFWGVAALFGQIVPVYATSLPGITETDTGYPMALFGVGVGIGSVLAGRLSGGKVEYGLIPLGALGLGSLGLILALGAPGFNALMVLMVLLGASSGLLLVPLNAVLQWRAPADARGGVIATANLFAYGGMIAASSSVMLLNELAFTTTGLLLFAAVVTLLGTLWALWLLPEALCRIILILLTNTIYRVRTVGREHVPPTGGVLLTPNHVSWVDGLFLLASIDRPVRFLVDAQYYQLPMVRRVMKWLGAIPISQEGGPRQMMRALKDAGQYLADGEVVCIFPEGQITRTGGMNTFRRGMSRIAKGRDAVIVPVLLDRVWGSIFSRSEGRFLLKMPKQLPYPVTVAFGEQLPTTTPPAAVRRAVQELSVEAWMERKPESRPLHRDAVRGLRRAPWKLAMADGTRPRVSRMAALAGAVAIGRALGKTWAGQERVGVLLPPSVGGALVTLAAALSCRTVVHLNYTAGQAGMESAARQAGLRTLVTSRVFVEKAELEIPEGVELIWLEDLRPRIGAGARLWAFLLALAAPVRMLERACGAEGRATPDDIATVIFSSGSTGEPKGVLLTHFNVSSNLEGVTMVSRLERGDRLLGILPLFHSFGFLALWFGLNKGVGTVFHPNPVDAAAVGYLVGKYRVTMLLATPTFLQLYLRRCSPEQFSSLRMVIAGAEKMQSQLRDGFEEAFGIRPLEGYGTTECSPCIAMSFPDFRAPGYYQPGSRKGTVGVPLPGVALRVEHTETGALLGPGEAGMLLVRGPNVMPGYLGRDDLTAKVLRDGWYVTGDVGIVDEDGFLRITDRLSRFSKIGGEMVPHGKVEQSLHEAHGAGADQVFAVTAIPDERKGERLAVLHTVDPDLIPGLLEKLAQAGLPNLFIPKLDSFVQVDALPVLGTGKVDLKGVKTMAAEALAK